MPETSAVGFIGLGNIGAPMATNIAAFGWRLVAFDAAGTDARLPPGGIGAACAADVARECPTVCLSLPHGDAVASVIAEIAGSGSERLRTVVDLSTIGVHAARDAAERLARVGVDYLDAPVSGGAAGAAARRIAVMCAGPRAAFDRVAGELEAISNKVFYVGERAGQGQALKLLNNFLSATALAATSEAVEFGLRNGLGLGQMLEVLNASSGQNSATMDKFPNHVATGRYASGFLNTLMSKDVGLYLAEARSQHCLGPMATLVGEIWQGFAREMPAKDFTRIFQYVQHTLSSHDAD